jgi:hypothetical protein
MIMKMMKENAPIVSIEMTIGLSDKLVMIIFKRITYDFQSKYDPPPDIGIKSRISAIDDERTP